ncbi:MAG TPA: ATP-binding protein [Edaphobacter sp.]
MNLAQFHRILRQAFLLPVVALLIMAGTLYWQLRGANETVRLIQEADFRISQTIGVGKLIADQESGLRGYEVTGDDRFLSDFRQAEGHFQAQMDSLTAATRDDATQKTNIEDLRNGYQNWHDAFALPIIATVKAGGQTSDITLNLYGKSLMDQVRQDIGGIMTHYGTQRSERIQQWQTQVRNTTEALIAIALGMGILIGMFTRNRLRAVSSAYRTSLEVLGRRAEEIYQSEQQLRRTQDSLLANEKLAVSGRLAAAIAHEIHNPLDSVSNLLYLLRTGATEEESRQFIDMAESELARVTQISRAMLGLYRESRAPVPVDLKEILEEVLLLMEHRFHELNVTARTELPEQVVIDAFPSELRQVFTNLISNAAEAAGKGGEVRGEIRIDASHFQASADKPAGAIIHIVDNGTGIPEEVRPQLFQPFFTTKGEHGTGLGLWVSQGIVSKHGGSIEIASDTSPASHGTVVTVTLAERPPIATGTVSELP